MNDSPARLMADLKAANHVMDCVSGSSLAESVEVQASVMPHVGFMPPRDPNKSPLWRGPRLRTGTDRHVWADLVWTPETGIRFRQDQDPTNHPDHSSEEYLQWMDRLEDLLDEAERGAAQCTVPGCVEDGPDHTAESMHASEVEWLCADDGAFGGLLSMNYTLEGGQDGAYLEFTQDTFAGSLDDLAAFADALADVAAQLKAKAQRSPFSTHRA
ncbi:hypothetical protein QO003_000040 [Arthrobacter silviterrae]|uniref:Uncharacterized protein n=1 Tax=Arthrobacter silviterrae TaxID=2026658 RepID=A0ABX0DF83_9MICC|nr:hypothetical protein [Arthrobacter silviterrae]MDQ0275737.1 hypothetical protein [Arthrobacter silviterrae]NGN83165.1 hypothetical protein [Arthrobacter silviterrae]